MECKGSGAKPNAIKMFKEYEDQSLAISKAILRVVDHCFLQEESIKVLEKPKNY